MPNPDHPSLARIALALHVDHPHGRRDAERRYELHRTLRRLVPEDGPGGDGAERAWRLLYRVPPMPEGCASVVWVQAGAEALAAALSLRDRSQSGRLPVHVQPLSLQPRPVACDWPEGALLSFALLTHPVRRSDVGERCLGPDEWPAYLGALGAQHGFSILGAHHEARPRVEAKNGRRLIAVEHTGTLAVTDSQAFARALTCGVGRGRAWGFGLLHVDPAAGIGRPSP